MLVSNNKGLDNSSKGSLYPISNVMNNNSVLNNSLKYRELNVFLCGVGTVGSSLVSQFMAQNVMLENELGLRLNIVGMMNSSSVLFDVKGVKLNNYKELLKESEQMPFENLCAKLSQIGNAVFVDCTASEYISSKYKEILSSGISVVTANKIAASSEYKNYIELKQIAKERGVKFFFETNVGAGLPIIKTINNLKNCGDKIVKIEAVLSGTLNYIFNVLSAQVPMSKAVKLSMEAGYAEPDPRIDLCGKDVVRKLVILAREAGYAIEQSDVVNNSFLPNALFEGSLDEFWSSIKELDDDFEYRRVVLKQDGECWRVVAKMEDGKASVSLVSVDKSHPFYNLEGSNNIVLLTTERYKESPMLIQGFGAGAEVTSAGVFSDIISIVNL